MDFTDNTFLFLFFPLVLIIYYFAGKKFKSWILIAASLVFIAFAGTFDLIVGLALTAFNYFLALQLDQNREKKDRFSDLYKAGILVNVFFLAAFKFIDTYSSLFTFEFLSAAMAKNIRNFVMPIGLSYLTFQNIAYLVEIHYDSHPPEKSFGAYLEYSIMFPKILTGPIMIYRDLKGQIEKREVNVEKIAGGIRRFILGFAKKALIADTLARTINASFNLSQPMFSTGIAWFMLASYTLQIYFDFSGYTDMAIGLGQMFGFKFMENFNYPYIAGSITDFWRRWHISLSTWIREYIFTPLEFKRRRVKTLRLESNLLLTFLLVGLWHGLTPPFIIWGLFQGVVLAIEASFLLKWLKKIPAFLQHIYTLLVVMLGWVFFRSPSVKYALKFILRLVGLGGEVVLQPFHLTSPLPIIDPTVWIAFATGIFFSTPFPAKMRDSIVERTREKKGYQVAQILTDLVLLLLFVFSFAAITSAGFVGNIYGGF